jgi:hypothetical protein
MPRCIASSSSIQTPWTVTAWILSVCAAEPKKTFPLITLCKQCILVASLLKEKSFK